MKRKFKFFKCISLFTLSLLTLTMTSSCDFFQEKESVSFGYRTSEAFYDEKTNLRYCFDKFEDNAVYVDKYCYTGEQISGDIVIDIEIPNMIDGNKVIGIGRQPKLFIDDKISHFHDEAFFHQEAAFAIAVDKVFDTNSNITININLMAEDLVFERYDMRLFNTIAILYQKDSYYESTEKPIENVYYPCKVNVKRVQPFVEYNKLFHTENPLNYDPIMTTRAVLIDDNKRSFKY